MMANLYISNITKFPTYSYDGIKEILYYLISVIVRAWMKIKHKLSYSGHEARIFRKVLPQLMVRNERRGFDSG